MIETTEILNEIEQDKVISFCADKAMFQAVKKYILAHLYKDGVITAGVEHNPTINWAASLAFNAITPVTHGGVPRSNEELGADLRAFGKAIQIIESGFRELSEIKKPEEPVEEEIKHV